MSLSAWSEAIPSGTSPVGTAPAYVRGLWAAISGAMGVEHVWNGSAGGSDACDGVFDGRLGDNFRRCDIAAKKIHHHLAGPLARIALSRIRGRNA